MPFSHGADYPYTVGGNFQHSDANNIEDGVAALYPLVESITGNDGVTQPASNGPFSLATFINNIVKQIKNITGKANWYTAPVTSIESLNSNKLDSSAYTAADVLTKIKTVDGAGSGLDADLLDGVSSASFAQLGSAANFTSTLQKSGKDVVFAQVGLTGKWAAQTTAPTSPADGDLWLDTSVVL